LQERRNKRNDHEIKGGIEKAVMKRIIIITTVYLSLASFSFGQADSTNFERLLFEFSQQYVYAGNTASANFLTQLSDATNFTLNTENPRFVKTKSDFTALPEIRNEDSILIKIADSIYKRFVNEFFWQDQQVDLLRFGTILAMYNEKLCACLSPVLNSRYKYRDLTSIVVACDSATLTDALFMSNLTAELKKISLNDRRKMQQYAAKYSYQHCPAYYQALNQPMFMSVIDNHYAFIRNISRDLEERVVGLYKASKIDSLRLIFPDYSLYKKDIEKSSASIKAKLDYTISDNEKDKDDPALVKRIVTFFREDKKIVLLGQVACTYKIDDLTLKVKSYQYITVDKIKNKEEILKNLEIEPPPPPIEELKEIRILKKEN
jgi:hypothetical protein